jgi:hypothetical protein
MKKNIIMAVIFLVSSNSVVGQTSTAYGEKYNNNSNLRFEKNEKVSTELQIGGHYSQATGDVKTGGMTLGVSRVYHKSPVFHWVVGGNGTADYSRKYGLMTDILLKGGLRVGKSLYFDLTPAVGVGQVPFYDLSKSMSNASDYNEYHNSVWRMKLALLASLGVKLSDGVSLSLDARYTYAINGTGDRQYQEAEGWQHMPTEFANGKLSLGASLSFVVGGDHQISGDNCWNGGLYTGYSFGDNKGILIGGEIFHFKRTSANVGRVVGLGVEQTIKNSNESFNAVYGKAGLQVLPKGANSPVIFEAGVKAGIGEYKKGEAAATAEGTYSLSGNTQTLGAMAKAYGSVNFHWGRNTIKVGVEGGGHTIFGTDFNNVEGSDVHIDGSASKKWGTDLAVTLGYTLSF